MRPSSALILFGFLVGLLPASECPAGMAVAVETVVPCGVLDPAGHTVYLANATGGIDALDLARGDLLWTTTEAQRPLLVVGDRLYAQAGTKRNRLRILAFDLTKQGACVLESDPLVFPSWVVTGEAHARSFLAQWRREKNNLFLAWQAEAWDPAPVGAPVGLTPRKSAEGLARIDLETGEVEMRPAEKRIPPTVPRPPRFLEKLAVRWEGLVNGKYTALILEEEQANPTATPQPRMQKLILRRWDPTTGKEDPPKILERGQRLILQLTPDERFFAVHEGMPSPDAFNAAQERKKKYSVTLFSVKTGQRAGALSCEPGTQTISLVGERAFCLVAGSVHGPINRPGIRPRTLQVIDVKTDNLLWEHAVEGKPFSPPGS
jgi:hypothetical protein